MEMGPSVSAALAGRADESVLKIAQPEIVWPLIRADRRPMVAMIIG
jgi:hypothetical protein